MISSFLFRCYQLINWKYFWGATMVPLCSRRGLIGPVPKKWWRLSWTNRRYWRNLGSLIRTKLETPFKKMEASRFSSSAESALCTMCYEGDIHCAVWQCCGNTAPHCTSKADGKPCIQLHVPASSPSSSAQEKTTTVGGREPHHQSRVFFGVNFYTFSS